MAKKLSSKKAKKILHDKSVHGHPLTEQQRKFFGAIARGAKPYKKAQLGGAFLAPITPQNVSDFFELFSIPQKAITKLISGKYQTPSEAIGIKNKAGAMATDILLDPVNLLSGAGILKASGAYKNAYKLNPWAFKPNEANWYRQVGKSAIDDAFETGLVREAGEEVSPRMLQEFENQLVRMQGSGLEAAFAGRRPASPYFTKGELFYPMGRKPTVSKKTGKISKNPAGKGKATYYVAGDGLSAPPHDLSAPANVISAPPHDLSAPANGKYTKKTKASAQNGKEMKFYQAGLDFQPKTISKKGSKIPKAQFGITRASSDATRVAIPQKDLRTVDEYRMQKAQENVVLPGKPKRSASSKAEAILLNPMTALSYKIKGQDIPENFEKGNRNIYDYGMDIVNPFSIVNAVKSIPENLSKGEFTQAGLNLLSVLPFAKDATKIPIVKETIKAAKDVTKAKSVREAVGRAAGIPLKESLPRMSAQDVTSLRMIQELSRMKDLGKSIPEQVKYALDNNLPEEHFGKFFGKSKEKADEFLAEELGSQSPPLRFPRIPPTTFPTHGSDFDMRSRLTNLISAGRNRGIRPSEDFMRNLLTPEQLASAEQRALQTGRRSINYSQLSEEQLRSLADQMSTISDISSEHFIRNLPNEDFMRNLLRSNSFLNRSKSYQEIVPYIQGKVKSLANSIIQEYPYYSGNVEQKIPSLSLVSSKSLSNVSKKVGFVPEGIKSGQVFTGSLNTSHSSYLPQLKQVFKYKEGEPVFLGYRPMNSLGYLSNSRYSNRDIAAYLNSEIDEQIKRGIIPKNIQRPFERGQTIMLPHYGVRKYKKGGVVKDNAGYWNPDNWGKPVEIDSNEITMEGVYEPLVGVSDTGDVQMMYPGEDYTFDGESVTEYPIAQDGVGIPKEIYLKQAFKESRFDPNTVSPRGAIGLAQIMKPTYEDFLKATKYKPEQIDLTNPEHSAAIQRWAMDSLYNAEFINKPNQSPEVRLAKTLAAYNYGRGNLSNALVAAKEKGIDIYNSLDWMKSLPKETSDYINKILLKKDDKFEKEYSEAVKKSPYAKYYKTGGNINQLDEQPLKKLNQLLNFTNMPDAKKGKKLKKAQAGMGVLQSYQNAPVDYSAAARFSQYLPATQTMQVPQNIVSSGVGNAQSAALVSSAQQTAPTFKGVDLGTLGGSPLAKTIQNVQRFTNALDERKKAKQFKKVSEVVGKAATMRPNLPKPKYVRPEDNLLQPDQMGMMPYGTGYDVLGMAEHGMQIGGNPTEIQNMYNPGTLYDNLGYEPLDESSKVKQYKKGGGVPKAQFGMIEAGMQLMDLGLGIQGALAEAIPGIQTKKWTQQGMQNLQQSALNQSLQSQFSPFMKDGGSVDDEYKWVSHSWQPQVITKFGEYNVGELLAPPKDADMLRAGGHLKAYAPPSEEAMSTQRMQMGGNLQTHWGGDAEVVSYNPYSPGSGETIMLRGNSHEESDGEGNTGIGMSYGGNMVEAERGEPVAEMQEGGSINDTSAVVYGNMQIPSYGVSELEDPDAKGKKFKSYAAHLAKKEQKQNKIVDKATNIIDSVDGDSPYDMLKINSAQAMLMGADMKLQDLAHKKKTLAGVQNAILETAEEMGLESDALARGKMKQAKKGAKIPKGQSGIGVLKDYQNPPVDFSAAARFNPFLPYTPAYTAKPLNANLPTPDFMKPVEFKSPFEYTPQGLPESELTAEDYLRYGVEPKAPSFKSKYYNTPEEPSEKPKKGSWFEKNADYLKMAYNEALPYLRPINKLPLDPSQLMGEQLALATNVLEPVRAQTFQPLLETRAPQMSAQEQLNKNQADFNAMMRQVGNNPAALSILAAQKQAADRQVIAQTQAYNTQQQIAANNRNIAMLNNATIENLKILDQQYARQEQAKAITKQQAQTALNSIAAKIGQNKLENFTSAVMQNMYNYRFGPQGRIINYNPLADFNIPNITEISPEEANAIEQQRKKQKTGKNGSIVKALK